MQAAEDKEAGLAAYQERRRLLRAGEVVPTRRQRANVAQAREEPESEQDQTDGSNSEEGEAEVHAKEEEARPCVVIGQIDASSDDWLISGPNKEASMAATQRSQWQPSVLKAPAGENAGRLEPAPREPQLQPSPQPPPQPSPPAQRAILSKTVNVRRRRSVQESRMELPVCAEEQRIMEAVAEDNIILLVGETGSGRILFGLVLIVFSFADSCVHR
eukprot:COSAG05_NODE_241_length_13068_cov_438.050968_3_plen_216_part_00